MAKQQQESGKDIIKRGVATMRAETECLLKAEAIEAFNYLKHEDAVKVSQRIEAAIAKFGDIFSM